MIIKSEIVNVTKAADNNGQANASPSLLCHNTKLGWDGLLSEEVKQMTEMQKRFCDEYLIDCNGTRAYKAVYPRVRNDASACTLAGRLLGKVEIQRYLDEQRERLHSEKIADAQEVLAYLSSVMRGEARSEIVVMEGQGPGITIARRMEKGPDEREKLKAAELLAKYHQLFVPKVEANSQGGGLIVLAAVTEGEP